MGTFGFTDRNTLKYQCDTSDSIPASKLKGYRARLSSTILHNEFDTCWRCRTEKGTETDSYCGVAVQTLPASREIRDVEFNVSWPAITNMADARTTKPRNEVMLHHDYHSRRLPRNLRPCRDLSR